MRSQAYENFMNAMDQYDAKLTKTREEFDKHRAERKKKLDKRHEDITESRRKGDMGRAWQVLQDRIDMRKTTEQDIYSGVDKSPEAREIRVRMVKNLKIIDQEAEEGKTPLGKAIQEARKSAQDEGWDQ